MAWRHFLNWMRVMRSADRALRRRGYVSIWCPDDRIPGFPAPRKRSGIGNELRLRIAAKCGFLCTYCGQDLTGASFEIDHVTAVYFGGQDEEDNLTLACSRCNRKKSRKPLDVFLIELIVDGMLGRLECQGAE